MSLKYVVILSDVNGDVQNLILDCTPAIQMEGFKLFTSLKGTSPTYYANHAIIAIEIVKEKENA